MNFVKIRKSFGLGREEFAEFTGIDIDSIIRIETGYANPTDDECDLLERATGVGQRKES